MLGYFSSDFYKSITFYIGEVSTWVVASLLICVAFFVAKSLLKSNRNKMMATNKSLLVSSFIVWILGLVIYTLGFYKEGHSVFAVMPRAVTAAFKMFVASDELGEVLDPLKEDSVYLLFFSIIHFAAAIISVIFIINLLGFRIKSAISLYATRWFRKKYDVVNIFWNINEISFTIAESIKNRNKAKELFIFINTEDSKDKDDSQMTLVNAFGAVQLSDSDISKLQELGAEVSHCQRDITDIDISDKRLFEQLGQNNVDKIVSSSKEIRIFFTSEDDAKNINSARTVFAHRADFNVKTTVYVNTQSNNCSDIYNHYSQYITEDSLMKIKIMDSSLMSVLQLKLHPDYHPVNFVNIDTTDCTVSSPFNSLVIGYGETGQEAFRYLYEFGSFPNKDRRKSPFKATIIDKKSVVNYSMPGIDEGELEFKQAEIDSKEYWEVIQSIIKKLNYVVVTLHNDDINLQTAIDIYKLFIKSRKDNKQKLGIFIRCHNPSNYARMEDIINKLNTSNENLCGKLYLFGNIKDIYTYDEIIQEDILRNAQIFHKIYEEKNEKTEISPETIWEKSFGNNKIDKKLKDYKKEDPLCTRYNVIEEINMKKNQNISNYLHRHTKYKLLDIAKLDLTALKEIIDNRESTDYKTDEVLQKKLINLAICEHIRWESYTKLEGYVYNPVKSVVKKHNNLLIPFEEIPIVPDDYKSYDCNVTDTSIRMYISETDTNNKNEYVPKPLDTSEIELPRSLKQLTEEIAENVHEVWAKGRRDEGWKYGPERNDDKKEHPCLVPYNKLPETEKEYDRNTAIETLKLIMKLGYKITKK